MDMALELSNSSGGGLGSGASVKVLRAVGLNGGEVSGLAQTDLSMYLGFFNDGSSSSSRRLPTFLSSVSGFPAVVADVLSPAILFLFVTLSVIPFVTRLVLLPGSAMLCAFSFVALPFVSFGRPGADCHPDRIHVSDLEVGKLLES